MLGLGLVSKPHKKLGSFAFILFFLIPFSSGSFVRKERAGCLAPLLLGLDQETTAPARVGIRVSKGMKKRQVVLKNGRSSSSVTRNVRYGECQKNHAANIGGYAVDGCREFMASGMEGTTGALTCAACGCHRNFHKREVETEEVCEYTPPNS
ncbi:hypothetical protein V6N13_116059 [Hibiscus sabdariffa]|uniref:ZF-HD dimerization-type domain-containing protein n=1 Tax=Hibiscus sabdariffa TaxID=183260 RepID=A0ABR2QTA5_9ROSI